MSSHLGQALRAVKDALALTNDAIGKKIDRDRSTVSRIMAGDRTERGVAERLEASWPGHGLLLAWERDSYPEAMAEIGRLKAELERLRSTPHSATTASLPDPGTPDARRAALRIAVDDVQRACLELAAALQVDRRSKASTKRTLARSRETTATKEAFQDALGRLEAALAEVTHLRRLERGAGGGELPPGLRERVAALAEALPQVPAAQRELVLAQLDLVAGTARSFARPADASP